MIGLTSIKVRLVGAFLAMALLASVIGAVGAHGINDVARGLSEVAGNVVPAVQGLGQVSTALEKMLLATHDALIAVSDKDLGSVRPPDLRDVAVRQLDQAIHDFEGLPKNAQQARVWKGFTDTVGDVVRTNQEAWELLGQGDRASALKHIAGARPKRELARSAQTTGCALGGGRSAEECAGGSRRCLWASRSGRRRRRCGPCWPRLLPRQGHH